MFKFALWLVAAVAAKSTSRQNAIANIEFEFARDTVVEKWKKSVKDGTGIMGNYTVYSPDFFSHVPATGRGLPVLTYAELIADAGGKCMQCLFTGGEFTQNVHNVAFDGIKDSKGKDLVTQ